MPARPARSAAERTAPDDDLLVEACLHGDERAWDALIDGYSSYIYAVAQRAYGLDPAAAAEVFQDTCIRLYLSLRTYGRRGEFRAWLRALVISACREHFRQATRHAPQVSDEQAAATMDDLETALDVRAAVDALGEPCRTSVALHFFADLTQAEIASRLGAPPGTIAARLSRCLAKLRLVLQEQGAFGPSSDRHG